MRPYKGTTVSDEIYARLKEVMRELGKRYMTETIEEIVKFYEAHNIVSEKR